MSEIQNWYTNKNVLVTGATGFIGKVLVEKLLRDCEKVNCIYLIMRGKQNFKSRCQEFLNHILFDNLRTTKPTQLLKIKIFQGDLTQENLGLSSNNLSEILANIDIVVHSAADVRFDLSLRDIFTTNTIGTFRFLELAKSMKKLQVFVFVSTTYSQSHQKVTEERHYDAKMDIFALWKALDKFDEQTMLALQPKILEEFPNTYSFSKHLTEDIVYRYRNDLPICVVRPSIVSSAIMPPITGYTEGLNGYNGAMYAALRGVLRTNYLDPSANIQTIPVDTVVSTIIAVSWIHGTKKVKQIEYYNANMANDIYKTYLDNYRLVRVLQFIYPLNYAVWVPNSTITKCKYYFGIRTLFYQILPSIMLDLLIWMCRHKPIMLKVQRKIYHGICLTSPYLVQMKFETAKFENIKNYLNQEDQKIFGTLDQVLLKPEILIILNAHGLRKFVAKEKDEDLPRARQFNLMLYWISIAMKMFVVIWLVKYLFDFIFKIMV